MQFRQIEFYNKSYNQNLHKPRIISIIIQDPRSTSSNTKIYIFTYWIPRYVYLGDAKARWIVEWIHVVSHGGGLKVTARA